jgi:TolC family type I secretion outer membrane protein
MTTPGPLLCAVFAALLIGTGTARAVTLEEAIGLALKHDPGLERVRAERSAAQARVREAQAGRLPTVALEGSVATEQANFHQFFGFGQYSLTPYSADLAVRQPLYAGGAVSASIAQAKAGDDAARWSVQNARLQLIADVAEAFMTVQTRERTLDLRRSQVDELTLVLSQARRKFDDGEIAISEVDEAQARLSAARAGVAGAEGNLAAARARYRNLVGEEPAAQTPVTQIPATPASRDQAVASAEADNPNVAAAAAAVRAAQAGVSRAKADRLPTVGLVAQASTVGDEFLPGYRADGVSVGVEGRWTLFAGATGAKIDAARADERAAEAALDQARATVEETAGDAWQARQTADALADAAADQTKAADAALESVRNEVRVGYKTTLDLLDAEREALAARIGDLEARAARVVAAYRLNAVIGQ